jgi:hypothetical protein
LYGAFVRARRALNSENRRVPARAVDPPSAGPHHRSLPPMGQPRADAAGCASLMTLPPVARLRAAERGLSGVRRLRVLSGYGRFRSHCRFVLPFIHFIPDSLTYSAPLFLER